MRSRLVFGVALLAASPAAGATSHGSEESPALSADLVLLDDEAHDALTDEAWRLETESFAPGGGEREALRVRVKVRPNRAMGRMWLAF